MKPYLTAQQLSFFGDHGYIAFEEFPVDLVSIRDLAYLARKKTERDLWREEPQLQHAIMKKLGPIALQLSRRKALYLASDDWIEPAEMPSAQAIQTTLSFQGLACIICLFFDGKSPVFFLAPSTWPSQVPHWPNPPGECYRIAFGAPDARYVVNPKDPLNHWLKKYGFGYGDLLHKNPSVQ